MMTGLSVVLGASLILFLGSLVFAVLEDWVLNRRAIQKLLAEHAAQAGIGDPVQRNFHRAARQPARVLGTYIF